MRILGVILAGGLSRRMGRLDKGLIDLAGKPLIAWVAERARPQVASLLLNANGDPARFAPLGLPVIADSTAAGEGPLAGIRAGLAAAKPEFTHIATFASDTPLFPPDLVARLATALGAGDYAVAASGGREHPVFGLWPTAHAETIAALFASGLRALHEIERHLTKAVADFPAEPFDPFFNANTPEELARLEKLLTP